MSVNTLPAGNAYPAFDSAASASLGLRGSAMSGFSGAPEQEAINETAPSVPATIAGQRSILAAGGMFLVLLLVLMFAAQKLGGDSEFKNIKVSFYNALVIGLAAFVTIPLIKFAASKVPVPAVNTWALAV